MISVRVHLFLVFSRIGQPTGKESFIAIFSKSQNLPIFAPFATDSIPYYHEYFDGIPLNNMERHTRSDCGR
jgi:hypothetical protein